MHAWGAWGSLGLAAGWLAGHRDPISKGIGSVEHQTLIWDFADLPECTVNAMAQGIGTFRRVPKHPVICNASCWFSLEATLVFYILFLRSPAQMHRTLNRARHNLFIS